MKKNFIFYLFVAALLTTVLTSCAKSDENNIQGKKEMATSSPSSDEYMLKFSTKDLDGNTVTEDIFSEYDVTLVNIWGTFCGPCKVELPDLEAAYQVYSKKKCNVLALTSDLYENDNETLELAKEIWKDSGCSFKAVISVDSFSPILENVTGVPTSFFVDKNGKILKGLVHTGRLDKTGFEKFFEAALKTVGKN